MDETSALDAGDLELLEAARAAREYAWCPYSGFRVGAAVRDARGRVFGGCNVENASFGLTICAERAAVARAVSEGARELVALALVTDAPAPLQPCGACRQVLAEFGPRARVLAAGAAGGVEALGLDELLPRAFGPRDLPRRGNGEA